ncbi:hypothetical protein BT63DRAFT_474083 [Microthyrium microscopicum]|uniref:Uncharacterized protein n=1 Tax=Microthyrium microscopicum TaxID=703497 RepID=A0A6A6UTR3_9PEZI|nr:hypothetical protein BT63DRAFT_474083 [Microthyrium microscopicum]
MNETHDHLQNRPTSSETPSTITQPPPVQTALLPSTYNVTGWIKHSVKINGTDTESLSYVTIHSVESVNCSFPDTTGSGHHYATCCQSVLVAQAIRADKQEGTYPNIYNGIKGGWPNGIGEREIYSTVSVACEGRHTYLEVVSWEDTYNSSRTHLNAPTPSVPSTPEITLTCKVSPEDCGNLRSSHDKAIERLTSKYQASHAPNPDDWDAYRTLAYSGAKGACLLSEAYAINSAIRPSTCEIVPPSDLLGVVDVYFSPVPIPEDLCAPVTASQSSSKKAGQLAKITLTATTYNSNPIEVSGNFLSVTTWRTETVPMDRVYLHIKSLGINGHFWGVPTESRIVCANGALIKGSHRGDLQDFQPGSSNGTLRHDVIGDSKDPWCVTDLLLTMKSHDVSTLRSNWNTISAFSVDFAGLRWPPPVSVWSSQFCGLGAQLDPRCQYIVRDYNVALEFSLFQNTFAFPSTLTKLFPKWSECKTVEFGLLDPPRELDGIPLLHGVEDLGAPTITRVNPASVNLPASARSRPPGLLLQPSAKPAPSLEGLNMPLALPGQGLSDGPMSLPRPTAGSDIQAQGPENEADGGQITHSFTGTPHPEVPGPLVATWQDKDLGMLTALAFNDGTLQVNGRVISPKSSPVTIQGGSVIIVDARGELLINGKHEPLYRSVPGSFGVAFMDRDGNNVLALLNGDGSYTIGGVNIRSDGENYTLQSGTIIYVGTGGQLVVNGQMLYPSLITGEAGRGALENLDQGKSTSTKENGPSQVETQRLLKASKKSGVVRAVDLKWNVFAASLFLCVMHVVKATI